MLRRRLFLQIYFTIIASLVIVVILSGLLWSGFGRDHLFRELRDISSRLAYLSLPAEDAPDNVQQASVERLGRELGIDIALFGRDRRLIASHGDVPKPPPRSERRRGWDGERKWGRRFGRKRGWYKVHGAAAWGLNLPDGRRLVVDLGRRGMRHPLLNLILFLGVVALGVGLGAYPLVRRLTRRLERLQKGVERIGSGDFTARVDIEGRDEVARLAESFNEAAEKIQKLLDAHRLLLANASHELRTPLARIRFGVEWLGNRDDPARRAALQDDITELDDLIDEILLMSRLDAGSHADLSQKIDLVALVAEECARYEDCKLSGSAPEIPGDPRVLPRLVRNLLENAHKHGVPPVEVAIKHEDNSVTLTISDGGDGISEALREKVFQPFYRAPANKMCRDTASACPWCAKSPKPTADPSKSCRARKPARRYV